MGSKSGGWKPSSDREHPPFNGSQKTSCVGNTQSPGPMSNHGGDSPSSMSNAVERTNPAAVAKK